MLFGEVWTKTKRPRVFEVNSWAQNTNTSFSHESRPGLGMVVVCWKVSVYLMMMMTAGGVSGRRNLEAGPKTTRGRAVASFGWR